MTINRDATVDTPCVGSNVGYIPHDSGQCLARQSISIGGGWPAV